ncbi:MAG: potassium transporter TrkG [Phycisphaerae bacterium]|jgi:trk system potassium uptake protein TrkH|nr:potassium transporter TrkG [Phycisphaerae bacterium]
MDELLVPSSPNDRNGRPWLAVMNVILASAGIIAIAALVLEYGFGRNPPIEVFWLHVIQSAVVAVFVADRVIRVVLARDHLQYLRENWTDFALMGVAVVVLAGFARSGEVLSAGAMYVIVTQVYILAALIIRGVNVNLRFADSGIHPARLLVGSFLFMCLVGSGLLMLPAAIAEGEWMRWYYLDSLFTATSATCVTGLVVKGTGSTFTPFGQAVILGLIQLGGLGIMMFGTVMAMMVGKMLSLKGTDTLGQMLNTNQIGRIARVARFVLIATFSLELIGALLMFPMFLNANGNSGSPLTAPQAMWYSVFHSVSAFCNAGFSLYDKNLMAGVGDGWAALRDRWQMMGVISPLIILGGLGFPVLQDIGKWFGDVFGRIRRAMRGKWSMDFSPLPRKRLTLHSKIVLSTTVILLVWGAVILWAVETVEAPRPFTPGRDPNDPAVVSDSWRSSSNMSKAKESIFASITARTAGFNTIDMNQLSDGGKLWMCGLMTIGGSPASTAGGMKTVTLAILVLVACSVLRNRNELEVYHRSVTVDIIRKVVALAILYICLLLTITLLLSITMGGTYQFIDLLFESCSACGTVGLSTGVTEKLNDPARCVVMAGMFIGRLGPLTLLLAMAGRTRQTKYSYPSENIIIG